MKIYIFRAYSNAKSQERTIYTSVQQAVGQSSRILVPTINKVAQNRLSSILARLLSLDVCGEKKLPQSQHMEQSRNPGQNSWTVGAFAFFFVLGPSTRSGTELKCPD